MKNSFEIHGDVCEIVLQKSPDGGRFKMLIDTADLPLVASVPGTWYALKSPHYTTHYGRTNIRRGVRQHEGVQAHTLIMSPPAGMVVDHKSRAGLDNRRKNLRIVTQAVNALNRRSPRNSTHGIRGVNFVKKHSKWRARIVIGGKTHGLGYHSTPESARSAVEQFLRSRDVPMEAACQAPA